MNYASGEFVLRSCARGVYRREATLAFALIFIIIIVDAWQTCMYHTEKKKIGCCSKLDGKILHYNDNKHSIFNWLQQSIFDCVSLSKSDIVDKLMQSKFAAAIFFFFQCYNNVSTR